MLTINDIILDPSAAANLPQAEITRLLVECAAAQTILAAQLAVQPAPVVDTIPRATREPEVGLITVPEAAIRLHRSPNLKARKISCSSGVGIERKRPPVRKLECVPAQI